MIYLAAGAVAGVFVLSLLVLYFATRVGDEMHRFYEARAEAQEKLLLDLAHKVSAPQQAAVDHVFERERERRGEVERRTRAAQKVAATEARLRELGVDEDELTLRQVPEYPEPA